MPRGIARVGTLMAQAHAQDFERKRRPSVTGGTGGIDDDGKIGGSAAQLGAGEISSDEEYGEDGDGSDIADIAEVEEEIVGTGDGHGEGDAHGEGDHEHARDVARVAGLLERHRGSMGDGV